MNKWLITVAVLTAIMVGGCSDTTTEGLQGLIKDGFIKGDVVSTRRYDDRPLNFSFESTVVDEPAEWDAEYNGQTVYIEMTPTFESNWNGDEYTELGIYLDSLNQDTATFSYGYFESMVPTGDSVVYFRSNGGTGRILTYHYDAQTNRISGTYTYNGTTYYGKPAAITGSFDAKVNLLVYKPSERRSSLSKGHPSRQP